jgi:hypothetical protein
VWIGIGKPETLNLDPANFAVTYYGCCTYRDATITINKYRDFAITATAATDALSTAAGQYVTASIYIDGQWCSQNVAYSSVTVTGLTSGAACARSLSAGSHTVLFRIDTSAAITPTTYNGGILVQ